MSSLVKFLVKLDQIDKALQLKIEEQQRLAAESQIHRKSAGNDSDELPIRLRRTLSAGVIPGLEDRYKQLIREDKKAEATQVAIKLQAKLKDLHESPAFQTATAALRANMENRKERMAETADDASMLANELNNVRGDLRELASRKVRQLDLSNDPKHLSASQLFEETRAQVDKFLAEDGEQAAPGLNKVASAAKDTLSHDPFAMPEMDPMVNIR